MPSATSPRLLTDSVGAVTVVRVSAVRVLLDEDNSVWLRQPLLRLVRQGCRILIVDLGNVHFVSSTTAETFLAVHHSLKAVGGSLRLRGLTPRIAEVFEVLRLTRVLDVRGAAELPCEACGTPA